MSTSINFEAVPAQAKCDKCSKEEAIPPQKSVSAMVKFMQEFDKKHEGCV